MARFARSGKQKGFAKRLEDERVDSKLDHAWNISQVQVFMPFQRGSEEITLGDSGTETIQILLERNWLAQLPGLVLRSVNAQGVAAGATATQQRIISMSGPLNPHMYYAAEGFYIGRSPPDFSLLMLAFGVPLFGDKKTIHGRRVEGCLRLRCIQREIWQLRRSVGETKI